MSEEVEHTKKVNEVRRILRKLRLPTSIPPQIVYNTLYHPDECTRISSGKFTTIEIINSNYGFDALGQLSLLLQKDIVEYAVCIITDKLVQRDSEKFKAVVEQVYKFNKYCELQGELVILREDEVEQWFTTKIKESQLWKPEELM